ncbi:BAH and coiled-coil domain-containing protein 1 [Paramormyrops kingsleyae]|uniref:BAH and coiled-coil domain-containing protein 1 n=1 Tax=Paramormyrops kingsleyae TaxID=1676925 RepID=UPI003B970561
MRFVPPLDLELSVFCIMEGRDFAPPPHLLSDRGALVHRAASRIAPTGHGSVQHPGHFQPGKYYPSPIPMAPHSGSGLMGNSSASFMGTFLAGGLGSPPSHAPHPSGPPSSPSSPPFRGGPHSSASQIWFPHSHEAAPGYPRFSGSLTPTFLPMSHLDPHGNSSVLYGQHRFYDPQKDNFYLRSLPSQPPLLSANHSFPPISRTAPGHPLGSCSRERDPGGGGGGGPQKSLKEGVPAERGGLLSTKDRDRSGGKQEAKDRLSQGLQLPAQPPLQHHPQHHPHPPHLQHPTSLEEDSSRHKEDGLPRAKQLSACLLGAKMHNGDVGACATGPLSSCGGAQGRQGATGERRELPDCLERGQVLHHAMPYSMAPPLAGGGNTGGFHCLPLHPSHPHHPHHPHHHHHHHQEFYCPPLPAPHVHNKGHAGDGGHELKVTGPTFVPSVGHLGDKGGGPFQLGNPGCRGVGGGSVGAKDKVAEKGGASTGGGALSSCQRKQQQQQHTYEKADKAPDWLQNQHHHILQQAQLPGRGRGGDCVNGADVDVFRPSLPQGAKGGPSSKSGPYIGTPPYRDCSHSSSTQPTRPQEGKGSGGAGCTSRDSQKVARIRHQQHARPDLGPDGPEAKRKPDMASFAYGAQPPPPLPPLPAWPVRSLCIPAEEEQRKGYRDPFGRGALRQAEQHLGMAPPETQGPEGEDSAMKSLLQYSSQQQPLLLAHKSPFGGLGCLQSAPGCVAEGGARFSGGGARSSGGGASCVLQEAKQMLPPRKGPPADSDRTDCGGGGGIRTGREPGEAPPTTGEGEVRQPPVGIAVAVARQREPPSCQPLDGHPGNARQGRVMPGMKGLPRPVFPLDRDAEEERKRMCEEPLGLASLDRERGVLLRDNKERVEFARIHPSSSCHGDLTSHLMVPSGTSLQASQLGADPTAHAHPPHHHWMPRTGSPSLWMTGHSYGISHAALHQNLPPGFSAAMPSPLQPVLPLPQDPPTQLVVLPGEPATHHLDVMDQPSLWPPVYGPRVPASHMQHPAVYSRSQFLRQQELYALQQQQQQQHRTTQVTELQHRSGHSQRKMGDPHVEVDDLLSEPRTPKPTKPFSLTPSSKSAPSPGSCASRLSPCCASPSLHPHGKAAAATPRSPALSPTPSHLSKGVESQDKRGKGQPPQDYPESLEPDLPPGYTYPAMGYRGGPSPQDVRLAEPADLEAVQVEPTEPGPQSLPFARAGQDLDNDREEHPDRTAEEEEGPRGGVEGRRTRDDLQGELFVCPVAEVPPTGPSLLACPAGKESLATDACQEEPDMVGASEDECQVEEAQAQAQAQVETQVEAQVEEIQEHEEGLWDQHPTVDISTDTFSPGSAREEELVTSGEGMRGSSGTPPASPAPSAASCPTPSHAVARCIWRLELLIAAALCGDPTPTLTAPPQPHGLLAWAPHRGMELLSELAGLEQQHQQGEELLTFDLQSLATLAAARALELDAGGHVGPRAEAGAGRPGSLRRTLNLRRKCSWTPRHEPVCPTKIAMETLDGQELAMRVRLAALQRRYKEKQKELAKLQRKQDHQKEETSRSPARRGPGRPRKRKSTPSAGPPVPTEAPKRASSLGAGFGSAGDDTQGGSDSQRKRTKLSSRAFAHLGGTQMKEGRSRPGIQRGVLSSKLARKVSQLTRKAQTKQHPLTGAHGRAPQPMRASDSGGQSDTASGDGGVTQEGRRGGDAQMKSPLHLQATSRSGNEQLRTRQVMEEKDTSPTDSESSEQDEEDEGSYDSEEGQNGIKAPSSKEPSPCTATTGPSPSSVVKLEANQKAKNKKERQGMLGTPTTHGSAGEVKVRKRAPCRPGPAIAAKRHPELSPQEGSKLARGSRVPPHQQEALKLGMGARAGSCGRGSGFRALGLAGERLKNTTCRTAGLQASMSKRMGSWPGLGAAPKGKERGRGRPRRNKQSKAHGGSRLLEKLAADEGFQMNEDSSFSDGDEDEDGGDGENMLQSHRAPPAALPNCVLTKELLVDGLKVLISKEDELLYAAYVHTLEVPGIYSVVIDGERGHRPRIYSLEQLLQEAVLEVRPETGSRLTTGTRVCAYWSERSRCLYPGYVQQGGPGEEQKEGSVMVEFDDGDRGWISLSNVRFLPPDYQIHCAEPPPTLLASQSRRGRRSMVLGKNTPSNISSDQLDNAVAASAQDMKNPSKTKPGKPKSVNSGTKSPTSDSAKESSTPLLTWPAIAVPRKKPSHNFFQFNGTPRKTTKGKDMFPLLMGSTSTPAKGIFRSTFEVDSFSSIANGCSSFGSQSAIVPLGPKNTACSRSRRPGEVSTLRSKKAGSEFLVKLDHEGVTSPKTKNSKALLLLGSSYQGSRMDKGFGTKGLGDMSSPMGHSHPVLLVKDNKKGGSARAELLKKGASHLRKPSPALAMGSYSDFAINCLTDCHGFYSDMDEEDEEEDEEGRAELAAASGGLRTAGRFLSRLSVSSSSSGSSSSSSSGSLSSSSLCSSDNDSSYSSEDEEGSTLLLQGCLSSHRALLPSTEPPAQRTFVAKAMAISSSKGGGVNSNSAHNRLVRRKECISSPSSLLPSKSSKELPRRDKLPSANSPPKMAPFLPARQLWRWSGNPTQRRGMKGKARKLFYKAIVRGRDMVRVGDCAVFLSAGRPNLPYIGRIESFWESWTSSMVVKVKWFYHPEETKLGKRHRDGKHALYQSSHEDENDVQTISHKCQVVSREEYEQLSRGRKLTPDSQDLYYLAGSYDPSSGQLVTAEGVPILC